MTNEEAWPERIGFSMAPFGYSTHAKRTEISETSVTYKCDERHEGKPGETGFCQFQVSVDPRDMALDFVKGLMRQHVDQAHFLGRVVLGRRQKAALYTPDSDVWDKGGIL